MGKEAAPKAKVRWMLPVAKHRVGKALRRAARAKMVSARCRKKLLVAAILPVALYGAEHTGWVEADMVLLEKASVQCSGLSVPGVPHSAAVNLLDVQADPRFKAAMASIERLARETWC